MKPITFHVSRFTHLAMLLLLAISYQLSAISQELPPLPTEIPTKAREMQNAGRRARVTLTTEANRQAVSRQPSALRPPSSVISPPQSNIQPAQQRIIDAVAAQKLREWKSADERLKWNYTPKGRTWNHKAFSRGLSFRSPKDAAAKESSLRDRKMKPQAASAPHESKAKAK